MSVGDDSPSSSSSLVDVCDNSSSNEFTHVQFLFRTYFMPLTYLFGIIANSINVIVFSQKPMRCQPVNWFFLVLSLSDLTVLIASFFVFSVPVYAESKNDIDFSRASALLVVWFYPMAQTGLTMSTYLTILVSVHRYLGVCHPFLIRRVSNTSAVKGVIVTAVIFAFLFNTCRWFELTTVPCMSHVHQRESLNVIPTPLMMDNIYTLVYRNAAYSIVMFFAPFAILTFVNLGIIGTLRKSYRLRRQMTVIPSRKKEKKDKKSGPTATMVALSASKDQITVTHQTQVHHGAVSQTNGVPENDRRENGVTIMLVAITTEFLLFNLLAFANNIIELSGANLKSQLETILVEANVISYQLQMVSALLVNINGASTIVIYLIFSSKYRSVFIQLLTSCGFGSLLKRKRSLCINSTRQCETTQLIDNKNRRSGEDISRSSSTRVSNRP